MGAFPTMHTMNDHVERMVPRAHLLPFIVHPVMQDVGMCRRICLDATSKTVRESIERESTTSMEIETLPPKHTGWGRYKGTEHANTNNYFVQLHKTTENNHSKF